MVPLTSTALVVFITRLILKIKRFAAWNHLFIQLKFDKAKVFSYSAKIKLLQHSSRIKSVHCANKKSKASLGKLFELEPEKDNLYTLTYYSIRNSDNKLIYFYQQDRSATPVDLPYSLHCSKVLSTGLCCTIYYKICFVHMNLSVKNIFHILC